MTSIEMPMLKEAATSVNWRELRKHRVAISMPFCSITDAHLSTNLRIASERTAVQSEPDWYYRLAD